MMKNIIKASFFLLLLATFLSSCGKVGKATNVSIEQIDFCDETMPEYQKTVFIAQNGDADLNVEFDKILDVKDKSTFRSIVLSNHVQEICDDAFQYCLQLEWIDISHSITKIDANAFYKCTSLSTVVIENSEIEIGSNAFEDCFALQTIYFIGSLNEWEKASEKCNGCLDNVEIMCCKSADELGVCFLAKE